MNCMLVGDADAAGGISEKMLGGGRFFKFEYQVRFLLDDATDRPTGGKDADFGQLEQVPHGTRGSAKQVGQVFFKLIQVFAAG